MIDGEAKGKKEDDRRTERRVVRRFSASFWGKLKKFNQGFRLRRSRKQGGKKKSEWRAKKQFQFLICEYSQAKEGGGHFLCLAEPDAQTV